MHASFIRSSLRHFLLKNFSHVLSLPPTHSLMWHVLILLPSAFLSKAVLFLVYFCLVSGLVIAHSFFLCFYSMLLSGWGFSLQRLSLEINLTTGLDTILVLLPPVCLISICAASWDLCSVHVRLETRHLLLLCPHPWYRGQSGGYFLNLFIVILLLVSRASCKERRSCGRVNVCMLRYRCMYNERIVDYTSQWDIRTVITCPVADSCPAR